MKFVDKNHSTAIQLADFLAYYSRRHSEKCEREMNAKAEHDEPLATMLRLFPRHRGVLAGVEGRAAANRTPLPTTGYIRAGRRWGRDSGLDGFGLTEDRASAH